MVLKLADRAIANNQVKCVIIAAGMGRRQGPLTNSFINKFAVAKPLLPVAGRKLIDFTITMAENLGLPEVVISAGQYWQQFQRMIAPSGGYYLATPASPKIRIDGVEAKDTMGNAFGPFVGNRKLNKDDTLIVLSGDIVTNIDLKPALEQHLKSNAAATVVALPVEWTSDDWENRGSPIIEMKNGMPVNAEEKSRSDRLAYEEELKALFEKLRGRSLRVGKYYQRSHVSNMVQAEIRRMERENCRSNYSITSVYFFKASLVMDIVPNLTSLDYDGEDRFSDFGFHLFHLLADKKYEKTDSQRLKNLIKKVQDRRYPFFAYVPPATGIGGEQLYWHDIYGPRKLWEINMLALNENGLANSWVRERFHKTGWGWIGDNSHAPEEAQIGDIRERAYYQKGFSVVGSNVSLPSRVRISHSFLDDFTVLKPGTEVFNSVISPGQARPTSSIGPISLVNCLMLGEGFPPDYADIDMIRDAIIFNVPYFDGFGMVSLQSKV
jgi:NDP-sugar pyrophosphorylase family protein